MDRVAITIWRGRVSPVFESAGRLLTVDIENGSDISREEFDLPAGGNTRPAGPAGTTRRNILFRKVARLREIGAETLICGAVSDRAVRLMNSSGIAVVGWVSGYTEDVISAFIQDSIYDPAFLMPGCCRGRGRQRRMRRGRGNGYLPGVPERE
jgi:predicted Fe-Mo cluster-binding NifX family protein